MSSDTQVGQPQEFGLNDFKDTKGFLSGARVKFANLKYVKHNWPANGEKPAQDVIKVIATVTTSKNQKNVDIDYMTNLNWNDKFRVSDDEKNLIANTKDARLPKGSEFYHLLTAFVNSGFVQKNKATTNLNTYVGADVVMVSEAVPGSKSTREKPYPDSVAGESAASASPTTQATAPAAAPGIDPKVLDLAMPAIQAIVAQRGKVNRNELAKELGSYATAENWDSQTRSTVLMSLYNLDNLKFVAEKIGLRFEGESVSGS